MKLGTELRLNTSFYFFSGSPNCTPWPYGLDKFKIQARTIEGDELGPFLDRQMPGYKKTLNDLSYKVIKKRPLKNPCIYREKGLGFNPSVLDLPDDSCLIGYFPCEQYFMDIRKTLLTDLETKLPLKEECTRMIESIREKESVCLHIRRGDYYSNASARKVHAVDLTDYYPKAIDLIKDKVKDPHFFIFSDEPEWARANLHLHGESTIVDINTPSEPEQDLMVMRECKNFIIANSTFSWWGAWLSRNDDKIVTTPRQWFLVDLDTKDLCPKDWIRI
ncbi:MAG: alpha-1,2-fucosyltransferase [Methanomassiliicoccales archaeon]